MRLYIAGLYTTGSSRGPDSNFFRSSTVNAQNLRCAVQHHLESYHYIHKGRVPSLVRTDGVKLFLDSGAFSAFSLGAVINIEAYAEFIRANKDIIEMASVLDAIGDPVGTFHNQQTLERLDCEVLPCFHFGEPLDLCEYYVRNYKYITLGGMVPIPNSKLEVWLDELWENVLTDKNGYARTKVHGFGMTARKLMIKYPWYSVDSSSWVQAGANGNVVFAEMEAPLSISDRSPKAKEFAKHYITLDAKSKAFVDELFTHYGTSPDEVATNYRSRWCLNAYSYHRLGEQLGDDHWQKPFKATQPLLF